MPRCYMIVNKLLVMFTMRKWVDLQLAMQLGFWVAMSICNSFVIHYNSLQLSGMSAIKQVVRIAMDITHYMWKLHTFVTLAT
jgi:hypothetical protein